MINGFMKKNLALAMLMGATASAYAANPFNDVSAGHWAYDAVAGLVADGIVDGYGITFGGDKLLTRYEIAQIVAKAMAKGANCDKLAGEFADEMEALGIKVAKLQKKVDRIKFVGQIRFEYLSDKGNYYKTDRGVLRTYLAAKAKLNDNWAYTGLLQNIREVMGGSAGYDEWTDPDYVSLKWSYLTGRIGGLDIKAGTWNEYFICDTILDDYIDAVQINYEVAGFTLLGLAGKYSGDAFGNHNWLIYEPGVGYVKKVSDSDNRLYIVGVTKRAGPVDLAFNYFKSEDGFGQRNIYNINADWEFAKDFTLTGRYMWTDNKIPPVDCSKEGWYGQLSYKGADRAKAHTWGLRVCYYDQPANIWISPTYYCDWFEENGGYDGWSVGGDYTLAKNIILSMDFYDVKSKDNKYFGRTWHTRVFFYF